jgi:hypothetical protein
MTARETEALRAAAAIDDEAELACELFLSLHAVRERLAHLEAKLDAHAHVDGLGGGRSAPGDPIEPTSSLRRTGDGTTPY